MSDEPRITEAWDSLEDSHGNHFMSRSKFGKWCEISHAMQVIRELEQSLVAEPRARPRARPRKLMRVVDAGCGDELPMRVHLECPHCGHDDGWRQVRTMSESKVPCPKCNNLEAAP